LPAVQPDKCNAGAVAKVMKLLVRAETEIGNCRKGRRRGDSTAGDLSENQLERHGCDAADTI